MRTLLPPECMIILQQLSLLFTAHFCLVRVHLADHLTPPHRAPQEASIHSVAADKNEQIFFSKTEHNILISRKYQSCSKECLCVFINFADYCDCTGLISTITMFSFAVRGCLNSDCCNDLFFNAFISVTDIIVFNDGCVMSESLLTSDLLLLAEPSENKSLLEKKADGSHLYLSSGVSTCCWLSWTD